MPAEIQISDENCKKYCSFMKIGSNEHMEKLYYEGEIYFNPLNYFRTLPSNTKMSDMREGAYKIQQAKNIKLTINDKIFRSESGQIQYTKKNLKGNIYCLYGLETNKISPSKKFRKLNLDLCALDWGDTVVYIYDTQEFLNRIDLLFQAKNIEYKAHPINYYDDKFYEGNLSVFYKPKIFEKQNEIRFWIPNLQDEAIKFNIESISDISVILKKEEFINIKYDYK